MRVDVNDVQPGDVLDGRRVAAVLPTRGRYTTVVFHGPGPATDRLKHYRPHTEVEVPRCPHCHQPPALLLDDGQQAFCGDEACDVLTWNPTKTAEEMEANKTIIDATRWEQT